MAAATKTKKAAKPKAKARKPAAKKKPARPSAKTSATVVVNPFAPDVSVGIWPPEEAAPYAADDREPPSKPIVKVKIDAKGELTVTGLKPGNYVASGQVSDSGGRFGARFQQITFVVKGAK